MVRVAGFMAMVAAVLVACAPAPMASVQVGPSLMLSVEIARTAQEHSAGLAGRGDLDGGMLFVFDGRQRREVWMAGMEVPLDVAWISDGAVVEIHTLAPCTLEDEGQCARWTSPTPVDALLEVPVGTLAGVVVGASVEVLEGGS